MSSDRPGPGSGAGGFRQPGPGEQYGGPWTGEPGGEFPAYGAPPPGQFDPRPSDQQTQPQYRQPFAAQPFDPRQPGPPRPPGAPQLDTLPLAPENTRRPVAVTLSSLLTVTASLQGLCGVAMIWLIIYTGVGSLDPTDPAEGPLFHLLERANLSLVNGLAAPMLGFPAASLVVGFLVLIRANWARILLTALGVGSSLWLVLWRPDRLQLVAVPILYVAVCVLLLWLPVANRWYRAQN